MFKYLVIFFILFTSITSHASGDSPFKFNSVNPREQVAIWKSEDPRVIAGVLMVGAAYVGGKWIFHRYLQSAQQDHVGTPPVLTPIDTIEVESDNPNSKELAQEVCAASAQVPLANDEPQITDSTSTSEKTLIQCPSDGWVRIASEEVFNTEGQE